LHQRSSSTCRLTGCGDGLLNHPALRYHNTLHISMKIIILPEASGKSPPDLSRFVNHVLFGMQIALLFRSTSRTTPGRSRCRRNRCLKKHRVVTITQNLQLRCKTIVAFVKVTDGLRQCSILLLLGMTHVQSTPRTPIDAQAKKHIFQWVSN
jgi:hypothetical protein